MVIQLIYRPDAHRALSPVKLPLSKSIALRVLTLNAVSRRCGGGEARVPCLPDAADVEGMLRALRLYDEETARLERGETPDGSAPHTVNIGEGGAPLRFFTALAASTPGIDMTVATGRSLMKRPLKPLLDALRRAGMDVRCLRHEGYSPLRIRGVEADPEEISLDPSVSSQFVSALMMASPLWRDGLKLRYVGHNPVSTPYIEMTAEIMRRYNIGVDLGKDGVTVRRDGIKAPAQFPVETDWSAASYLYELALLLPGVDLPVEHLTPAAGSLQGDARCAEIFGLLGVATTYHPDGSATLRGDAEKLALFRSLDHPLELDLNATPDLVPALAVGFCFAGVKFRFTGIGHLRHKESNRMTALANELERVGYMLTLTDDTMSWEGRRTPSGENETIATYADHRMAMAFAPAAVKLPYLAIDSPEVVEKSFPKYWDMLKGLGFELRRFGDGATRGTHYKNRQRKR